MNVPAKSASGVRRCLLLFALLTVLLFAGAVAVVVWPHPSAITRENEARIRDEMTLDELQAILGGPPRDESTGPTEYDPNGRCRDPDPAAPSVTQISEWISDEVMIRAAFDADGRAEWISSCPLRRNYPGIQPTIQHWLFRVQKRFR